MSDSGSDSEEGFGGFVVRKKYTIILLDGTCSMENGDGSFQSCMQDIFKIYTELETFNYLWKFNCGVVAITNDPCDLLIDLKSKDTTKLKAYADYHCTEETLYLKESLEFAVDLFYKQKIHKNDIKTIILLTNNPKPKFDNENDAIASARLLRQNRIEFLLFPTNTTQTFANSKFYELFFKQLDENMCEMIKIDKDISFFDILCELLSPPEQRTKIRFYLDKYHYFDMIQHNLFRPKYAAFKKAIKTESGDIKQIKQQQSFFKQTEEVEPVLKIKLLQQDDDDDDQEQDDQQTWFKHSYDRQTYFGVNNHRAVFKQSELDEMASINKQPKNNELLIMYLGKEPTNYVVSAKFRSRLIKPTRDKQNKMKFRIMWQHCVDNKKVIYCYMLGKYRLVAVLKPIFFQNNPVFIKYTLGWADNYHHSLTNSLPVKKPESVNSNTYDVMNQVVQRLKTDSKSFLDIRDPKILFEETLTKAKINKTTFEQPEDKVCMEYHEVNEKLGEDLIDSLKSIK